MVPFIDGWKLHTYSSDPVSGAVKVPSVEPPAGTVTSTTSSIVKVWSVLPSLVTETVTSAPAPTDSSVGSNSKSFAVTSIVSAGPPPPSGADSSAGAEGSAASLLDPPESSDPHAPTNTATMTNRTIFGTLTRPPNLLSRSSRRSLL